MKLTKAIEILELNLKEAGTKMPPDCRDAIKLGINALQMIDLSRNLFKCPGQAPLPGETKEESVHA